MSTVPNTGRNQSDSGCRGLDEEEPYSFHQSVSTLHFLHCLRTSKHAYFGPTSVNVGIGSATSPSGDDVGPTLFRRRLKTSPNDVKPPPGDDVGSTVFRRRLATSPDDAKPTSSHDFGPTLFRRQLATTTRLRLCLYAAIIFRKLSSTILPLILLSY